MLSNCSARVSRLLKSTLNIHWKDLYWSSNIWPFDGKNWLTGKDSDAAKNWRLRKQATEDKMAGWHHRLSGHEFEQTLGDSERQGSLAGCSSWGHKESGTTKLLNNNIKLPRNEQTLWEEKYIWFYWKILEKYLNKGNNMIWYKILVLYMSILCQLMILKKQ